MLDVIYEDENIRLRKGKAEDAYGLQRLLTDPEVMLYYGEHPNSLEYAQKEIQWFGDLFNQNAGRWVIEDIKTGLYIGDVGIFNGEKNHKKCEIGYKLDKAYWKQGIMTKCLQAVMQMAFSVFGYNRIEALVDVNNIACIQLLLRNGFTKEGTLRDYEFEHGGFVDLEIHSILKREYLVNTNDKN